MLERQMVDKVNGCLIRSIRFCGAARRMLRDTGLTAPTLVELERDLRAIAKEVQDWLLAEIGDEERPLLDDKTG